FNPWMIGSFLVSLTIAYHSIRNGKSPLWLMGLALASFVSIFATMAVWIAYLAFAVIPDLLKSHSARRFADNVVNAADPGRAYREKLRNVELVGSVDSKRALAEECIKTGRFSDAIELYESAMQGPLGAADPTLLKGLGRARMLSGQGAEAEALFVKLKEVDPAAFDSDAELDYARALALQGKNDAAVVQYEKVVSRYPGEEARARFGLLLETLGQHARAQALFAEILKSVKGAPSHYRSRQREWVALAKAHMK
ncbi:MAG TPA: tetratricopeptide repeat protein, partial [Rhizomicrobium sp.]|nr:tetratricopeptide repeat protein [Rhizomicrobium sp.]